MQPFDAFVVSLNKKADSFRASEHEKPDSLPELIRLQENQAVRKAWQEIEAAISENEALPERERLPEPYFARAEIWASVNAYAAAVQDYLTAIKWRIALATNSRSLTAR